MVLADEAMPLADDTKINIEIAKFDKNKDEVRVDVGQKLIGLTKEELEHFKNDPFWRNLRVILFALFWLLWAAMFVGAILIVVLSPKCAEKQQPKWWQTKVSYQVLVPTFFDSEGTNGVGSIDGLTQKIDLLRKIGVTTVYPSPVLTIAKDEYFDTQAVVDHLNVDPKIGTNEDLKKLIDAAHDRDMYVVLDLPLSSVSIQHPWMQNQSTKADDVFVWKNIAAGQPSPPGFHPAPARGGKQYLGYPDAQHPVLNWKSDRVKNTIMGAIHTLIDLGVDGFNLDHVSRLAVDDNGQPMHDEAIKRLAELSADIRAYQKTKPELAEKEIVLFSSLHDMESMHAKVTETNDLQYTIDNSFTKLSAETCGASTAKCVHEALSAAFAREKSGSGFHPYWQFSNAQSKRLASRFDSDTANLLTFTQLTLPGAMSLYYGQELGLKDGEGAGNAHQGIMQWEPKGDNHHGFSKAGKLFFAETAGGDAATDNFETQYAMESSPLKVYQKLAKLRQRDEVMIIGETNRDEVKGEVIVFSRFVRASPESNDAAGAAYVVVLNFGASEAPVDLNSLKEGVLPTGKTLANAEVVAVTPGVTDLRARDKTDLSATELKVPGKQGVLLRI
ncbi:hypothetical protein PFISCL1PPCAC_14189 [Pristionchus fissidentatus]|uniref:Glycosyl hydrolase family 13 catalytic domain-containing protein n=1 Tax=Pristionchus fissidentatus TaxID=1538716 RepID=A0AAV5VVZ7_9BILA|nr:hypothetical protein PFISCL1PPCAC_14189 [Pristionchus fissidentatus]